MSYASNGRIKVTSHGNVCCRIINLTVDTTWYSSFCALTQSSLDARDTVWVQKTLQQIAVKGVTRGCFSLCFTGCIFSISLGIKNSVLPLFPWWTFMQSTFKKSAAVFFVSCYFIPWPFLWLIFQYGPRNSGRDARIFILTWLTEKVLLNSFTKARNWTTFVARTDMENCIIKYCFAI